MEKLKKIATLLIWRIQKPLWKAEVKRRDSDDIRKSLDEVNNYFQNLLYGTGIMGPNYITEFDQEVRNRLIMIIYWYGKILGTNFFFDDTTDADQLMWQINAFFDGLYTVKKDDALPYFFVYKYEKEQWKSPSFDGEYLIWNANMSSENRKLAYMANLLRNIIKRAN